MQSSTPTQDPQVPPKSSRPWNAETRRWILVGLIIAAAFVLYWIRDTLPVLILALLLAYLLNPLVVFLEQRLRTSRLLATALVYLALIALIGAAVLTLIPMIFRQIAGVARDLDHILSQLDAALGQLPLLDALGVRVDVSAIAEQLRAEMTTIAAVIPRLVLRAASGIFTTIVVLVLSFYLLKDSEMIGRNIDNAVPMDYRDEWRRLQAELAGIWSSFLRGQILLALIIGTVTTLVLAALGVRNALFLGLLAGILEVVPTIGPIIAAIPAILIAFFQGSSLWAIESTTFAAIVIIAYILIQQLENHLVVPSVLGSSVNLPPVVILFGALAGASLAGVLGIFLAAPVLATARLALEFLLRKLLEPTPVEMSTTWRASAQKEKRAL